MLFPSQNPSNIFFNFVKGCHQLALRCSIGCKTPLIGSRLPRAFDPQPTFKVFSNQLALNNQTFERHSYLTLFPLKNSSCAFQLVSAVPIARACSLGIAILLTPDHNGRKFQICTRNGVSSPSSTRAKSFPSVGLSSHHKRTTRSR